jgi:hypothetical protein
MPALLAALLAMAQPVPPPIPAGPGGTAWVFSTVGHSEWCPAGNVILDLRTGRYTLTRTASRRVCSERGLERPVLKGRLAGPGLEAARAAYRRAWSEGLESRECRAGGHPRDVILVSNGGTPLLVATSGWGSLSAPDDLTCWSAAANGLHEVLDKAFGAHPR